MLRQILVLFVSFSFFLFPHHLSAKTRKLKIGVVLPQSGELGFQGRAQLQAIYLARDEVNAFFKDIHVDSEVEIYPEDSETNPEIALKKLKKLKHKGIHVVIGPNTSQSAHSCLDYANQQQIILISPSSTAPSLAKENDNLFRLCPSDQIQVEALTHMIQEDHTTSIICINRKDLWGEDLVKHLKLSLEDRGISVLGAVRYPTDIETFSEELDRLHTLVEKELKEEKNQRLAIFIASFDEITPILEEASKYPLLASLRWYGADGAAKSIPLIKSEKASNFAMHVQLQCPKFEVIEDQLYLYEQFSQKMEKLNFPIVDAYVATAYDAVWITAMSSLGRRKGKNARAWRSAIDSVASHNLGITGWSILNSQGDRSVGDYSFWAIKKQWNGSFTWSVARVFHKHTPTKKELENKKRPSPQSSIKEKKLRRERFRNLEESSSTPPLNKIKSLSIGENIPYAP